MEKFLVIYDLEGQIILIQSGYPSPRVPVGVPSLIVEIPQGKYAVRVDVSQEVHEVVFEDLPKNETQMLQEENINLKLAIAELAEQQEIQKIEIQLALAELAESIL